MKYSIQEVAECLSTSIKVIRRLVASGELRAIKKSGAYTISEEDLQVYLNREGQQDNRMWSNNSSRRNGRLQISAAFRREHQMDVE